MYDSTMYSDVKQIQYNNYALKCQPKNTDGYCDFCLSFPRFLPVSTILYMYCPSPKTIFYCFFGIFVLE